MASIFQRLTKRDAQIGMNEWANMFQFDGNTYPLGVGTVNNYGNTESIANDFCGYVQGAYKASGPVFAVQLARMMVFTEMRFTFRKREAGRLQDYSLGPELEVLEHPWYNCTTGELLARALQDADFGGNHYVVREGVPGRPGNRLRRLRPDWVEIILTAPPAEAVMSDVAGYLYKPGGTSNSDKWVLYLPGGENGRVAHWSPIPDPEAQYRGMSWITPILREIMADKSATRHKQGFFDHAATPNIAVSLKESVTEAQFKRFKAAMEASHAGATNAYKTLYLGGGADVTVLGANMKQMDFQSTQGVSEMRIAAAGQIPSDLVFQPKGSALNQGNYNAIKDKFADMFLRPTWRGLCAAYANLLDVPAGHELWYDDRDVAFLLTDQKELSERRAKDAETIGKLLMNGATFDSAREYVRTDDLSVLESSGQLSVQLTPATPELFIQAKEAEMIEKLAGQFEHQSVIDAVTKKNWNLLKAKEVEPEPEPEKAPPPPPPQKNEKAVPAKKAGAQDKEE